MPYKITVLNADEFKNLKSKLFKKPLRKLLSNASLIGERVAKSEAPKDTGSLVRDIRASVSSLSAKVTLPRNLTYYHVMEEGRRPGAKMPPPRELHGWMRRHGIPVGAAFVIARSIARRGIKGRFFMRQGAAAVNKKMPGLLRKMGKEVGLIWQD